MLQSNSPAAKLGVMPDDTASAALNAPLKNKLPAVVKSEPMPKCVMEFEPPVQAGKFTAAVLEALAADTVQPAPERATATRA